jgi:hypothetical protein
VKAVAGIDNRRNGHDWWLEDAGHKLFQLAW